GVAAGAATWIEKQTTQGSRDGLGAIAASGATLRACVDAAAREPHLDVCLGGELGAFAGRGLGIAHPRDASPLWSAAGPGFSLRTDGRISSAISLDVPIALSRPSFTIGGAGEVFKPAFASVRLAL